MRLCVTSDPKCHTLSLAKKAWSVPIIACDIQT